MTTLPLPPFEPVPFVRGEWIAWRRPALGLCYGRVRGVYEGGITADRVEIIRDHEGVARPRTKPHFIKPGEHVVRTRPPRWYTELVARERNADS